MITDEMLSLAAGEAAEAMVASVPLVEHTFSPAFQRRMAALLRRGQHPAFYRFLRQTAAAVVAAIMTFALLYMTSPTVQAAVNSWIRSTFGDYFQYSPVETTPPDVQYDYALPEEFDGYTLLDSIDRGEDCFYVYYREDGEMLFFDYMRNTGDANAFIDVSNCIYDYGTVGKNSADIYLSQDPEINSMIVWIDTDTQTLLSISAIAGKEELIAIAEKVQRFIK